jgi:hypothetical protein
MPYQEMHKRPAPSNRSLTVHYESHPPYFYLFKAISKMHYLLAALIVSTILANVLAVALGGLFLPNESSLVRTAAFHEVFPPNIHAENIRTILNQDIFYNPNRSADELMILDPEPGLFYAALPSSTEGVSFPPWTTEEFYFLPFQIAQEGDKNAALPANHISQTSETWGIGTSVSCRSMDTSEVKIEDIDESVTMASKIYPKKQLSISVDDECYSVQNATRSPNSPVNVNISFSLGISVDPFSEPWLDAGKIYYEHQTALPDCAGTFIAGWVPYTVVKGPDKDNLTTLDIVPIADNAVNMICTADYHAARFAVTVDKSSKVLSYEQLDDLTREYPVPFKVTTPLSNESQPLSGPNNGSLANPSSVLAYSFQYFLFSQSTTVKQPRIDPRPQNWVTYFMQRTSPQLALGVHHNLTATAEALEKVYTMLFPFFMHTYRESLFIGDGDRHFLPGHVISVETRMRVSQPMLILAVSILSIFVLVIAAMYIVRPGAFLRHIPTTLAATIPYIYASKVGEDLAWAQGPGGQDIDKYLSRGYRRYGYGWFQGRDGEMHLGIDREPVTRDSGEIL